MNEATSMANKTNGDQKKENVTSDWRDKKSINECVNYLSEHKMWHDVTFSISGKHLHGHRLILSLRSPVFEAMFYGPVADKNEVIEITDIEYDIFSAILRDMYKDTCDELTGDNVLPIFNAAKKYCLSELEDRCSLFLDQTGTSMANKTSRDHKKENVASDWRDKKSINHCLGYLSEHKMWHDVTFSTSGKHLYGHRLILSLRSPVFEAMFYGPVADKNEVIEVADIEYDIFDNILRYIYTDTCDELTGDNVLSIFYAAKKYCLLELEDRCSLFLEQSLSIDNVCVLYEQAKLYDMDSLVKSCFDLMIKESNDVCKSDSSIGMSYDSLLEFLSSEHLTGDELVYFKFVKKWANQKCLSNGFEQSPGNKRKVLGDIVKKISYQLMKAEDFERFVVPTNILLPEEQSQIFQYIATRDKSCIEKFSIPPRLGFPVTIDTRSVTGPTTSCEYFCFQFSCNTDVRLVKLFPITLEGISDFGKKDVKDVDVVTYIGYIELITVGQKSILDESAAITKDPGIIFEANKPNTVEIYLQTKNMPDKGFQRQKPPSIAHTCLPTCTNGSFSCAIHKIPCCVEVVEFRILPK